MGANKISSMIPLQRINITESDIKCVSDVLRSGFLVQGKQVEKFEASIAKYVKTKEAIAVSNGTASLHLALLALNIGKGDEVIVPAFSYIATANVVELVGARPIFIDIDINTYNINIDKIEKAITKKTKAIIPVHEFGLSCEIAEIQKIAKKHSIQIIEDAACALGSEENNKKVGSYGIFGSFSFHPRKAITSGEGGILTTNDKALANRIRILRNHGISIQNKKMEFVEAGFNYRMTDIQATLLNSQFKRLKKQIKQKNTIAKKYLKEIININISLPTIPNNKNHTWQTFHILLANSINRDNLITNLVKNGIYTNYGAQCIPFQKYYANKYKLDCHKYFPNAMLAYNNGLAIPLYPQLSQKEISYIINTINKI